ncbi:kinase-like domain-containing protein [Mycena pura]|uniref:Kinase-like domain-containing protein n=1 Tax=Mycena pura TaxID=153505 RepID=A0AAD6XWT5_9AGAR|nr:kinase-like domain-containing protein [Mycena pura]
MCTGCGNEFDWALDPNGRCGRCSDRDADQNLDWKQCEGCGRTYQWLEMPRCGSCVRKDENHGKAKDAMAHPPHPHSRGTYIPPAEPPLHNPAQHEHARNIMNSMVAAHANARASNPNIARSKIHGTVNYQPSIQFKVAKVVFGSIGDTMIKSGSNNTQYKAMLYTAQESDENAAVKDTLAANIDKHMTEKWGIRITSANLDVYYSASKTAVPEVLFLPGRLVRHWWAAATGSALSQNNRKAKLMDIYFVVSVPNENTNPYLSTILSKPSKSKRKAPDTSFDDEDQPLVKRPTTALVPSGAGMYRTVLSARRTHGPTPVDVCVHRTDFNLVDAAEGIDVARTRGLDDFTVQLWPVSEKGKTKEMSVAQFPDGKRYAAKAYYNVDESGTRPTAQDNYDYLVGEVTVQILADHALGRFKKVAAEKDVMIVDISINKPFLLEDDDDSDRTWIVDRLLSSTTVIKYSGTAEAGLATSLDLYGRTCDAFAHFSVFDSQEEIVFVDIQGIKERVFCNGLAGADALVLFDLMAHTASKIGCLGDQGKRGIEAFKKQHNCNTLCHALGLPVLDSSASTSEEKAKNSNLDALAAYDSSDSDSEWQ